MQSGSFLSAKYNFMRLFFRVWVKLHFSLKNTVIIKAKSSLKPKSSSKSLTDVLISLTTENREASSANCLHLLFFLYIQFTLFQTKSLQSPGTCITKRTWDPSEKAYTKKSDG